MKTEKELLMMYHTALRNIGLYTSISLAALAYSRAYRGKGFYRNIGGIVLSLSFIIMAMTFNRYLASDLENYLVEVESTVMSKWYQLLPIIGLFQSSILLFNIYTLYLELTKKI